VQQTDLVFAEIVKNSSVRALSKGFLFCIRILCGIGVLVPQVY
jgi:hypothetical protein